MPAQLTEVLRSRPATSDGHLRQTMQLLVSTIRAQYDMEAAFVSQFLGDMGRFEAVDASVDFRGISLVPGQGGPLAGSYCQGIATGSIPELIRDAQVAPEVSHLGATAAVPTGPHLSVPIRQLTG